MEKYYVIKKDGRREDFDPQKIIAAVNKSSLRVLYRELNPEEIKEILDYVKKHLDLQGEEEIPICMMHAYVEGALDQVNPKVAKSYRDYRDRRKSYAEDLMDVYSRANSIMFRGDKENSNADSSLISTKRSLIFNELNKKMYKAFFLNEQEISACNDGYIYVHDMSARRDTMNCCLFDMESVLNGGFEMGNMWYNEPSTLDTAFDVMGDVVLSAASQQYGGFTVGQIDKILAKYAEKSFKKHLSRDKDVCHMSLKEAEELAMEDVKREAEQGFQGWEYKFNTVASSRGDYPFTTMTLGLGKSVYEQLITKACFKVRAEGQGRKGHKKPVLFPKLVFLYDENLHGKGKELEGLFNIALDCSLKAMYPDWLSLTGPGYLGDMYRQYGAVISPMGCRAFLSPWYEKGGMYPFDENDKPVFTGRFNIGVVSLNLPMIYKKSVEEGRSFEKVLDHYLNMIRQIHKRTYEYLAEMKASTNPMAYCEGGFYGGHLKPHDKIRPLLSSATASFGITALNELQELYNGRSIAEDGKFALKTLQYINDRVNDFKHEDGHLYAIYGTPAESLCGKQVDQFRKKYGIIKGVSDRPYVSNSFHCHVTEKVTATEKQDLEYRFWDLCRGGRIQYVRYPINYNRPAVEMLIRRAMAMGFYEGVNLSLAYCEDCGHEELEMDECPKCGSRNLTKIDRMCGYLSYSRVHSETRLNTAKMAEIAERVSM